jgi:alkyl hydroperoxide reductase subunit AhpC
MSGNIKGEGMIALCSMVGLANRQCRKFDQGGNMALSVGCVAPDFEVEAAVGSQRIKWRLSEHVKNNHVLLTFHPLNWSPVCSIEARALNEAVPRFRSAGAELIDVSADHIYSHLAWQELSVGSLQFPLGSDFFPHGEVARQYGVFRTGDPVPGISERAAFVIERETGIIRFARTYHLGEQPDIEKLLDAVRQLNGNAHE